MKPSIRKCNIKCISKVASNKLEGFGTQLFKSENFDYEVFFTFFSAEQSSGKVLSRNPSSEARVTSIVFWVTNDMMFFMYPTDDGLQFIAKCCNGM